MLENGFDDFKSRKLQV